MPDFRDCRSHMPQPTGRNRVNGLRIEVNHFPLGRCLNKPPVNHLGVEADAARWLGSGGSEQAFGVCDVNDCPLKKFGR